jgi:hypothetical protein
MQKLTAQVAQFTGNTSVLGQVNRGAGQSTRIVAVNPRFGSLRSVLLLKPQQNSVGVDVQLRFLLGSCTQPDQSLLSGSAGQFMSGSLGSLFYQQVRQGQLNQEMAQIAKRIDNSIKSRKTGELLVSTVAKQIPKSLHPDSDKCLKGEKQVTKAEFWNIIIPRQTIIDELSEIDPKYKEEFETYFPESHDQIEFRFGYHPPNSECNTDKKKY